jgi:molybdopterin-guanine dinucleotide biosynthesis protein A
MKSPATTTGVFPQAQITGIVLAGGRGQRMGGIDKGLVPLNGRPMVAHVLDALRPQVGAILINANRNLEQYGAFGYEVVPDAQDGYLGPLAGLASGMQSATTPYVVTVPCDSPLLGEGIVKRLYDSLMKDEAEICVAHDGERTHPVFTLLKRELLPSLLAFLDAGDRKIDRWFANHKLAVAYFADMPQVFVNVNSPEERQALEARITESRRC